jgi:hypothetical protein
MYLPVAGVFTGEEAGKSMLSPALIQPNIFPAVFLPAGKMVSLNKANRREPSRR